MKNIYLIHLGIGKVGRNLVDQIMKVKDKLRDRNLINLIYCGLYNSHSGYYNPEGISNEQLTKTLDNLERRGQKKEVNDEVLNILNEMHQPFVLIDTTASEKTFPIIFSALAKGGCAVLSNKKPLTMRQEQFDLLHQLGRERLFYETIVGAGLPVISTLRDLIDTGDEIIEIKGCFSGTLGYIFSQLDKGERFSEAVMEAKESGFTEPDPRDDLSGVDVLRKALILARMIGQKIEMKDIKLQALYPESFNKYSIEDFMRNIKKLDKEYKEKFERARQKGNTFRYVAKVSQKSVEVGLTELPQKSDLGNLNGPDNIIVFKTKRYFDRPMVVKGPGAGIEVTASGVFADILNIANII